MPTPNPNVYNRIMLDLETYGTRPGCGILSIGAVFFSSSTPAPLGPEFYVVVSRESCLKAGLHEDPDTLAWWDKQGSKARVVWDEIKTAPPLAEGLKKFGHWVRDNAASTSVQVWGNGADFDNPILSACYRATQQAQPWGNYSGRCYRTLKALRSDVKMVRVGVHHNALDDAKSQALHAVNILKALKAPGLGQG